MNTSYGDEYYQPNPGGFYELAYPDYKKERFPLWCKGKVIKVLRGGLPDLTEHKYKAVFMLRHPEEIRQSYEAFFETGPDQYILRGYLKHMAQSIEYLNSRDDIEFEVFHYRSVVEDPEYHFNYLADKGWPIDPQKASAIVNPDLYRFRLERLTVGL